MSTAGPPQGDRRRSAQRGTPSNSTRSLVGSRLRARRKALGLTQAGLASALGISPSYLNLIEGDRRKIGGVLLQRVAHALGLPLEHVGGAAERRLADSLGQLATDPLLATLSLDADSAAELISRHPAWAGALVTLHRAYQDRSEAADRLRDRLSHDPVLSATVHALLTQVSAIRSAAEILDGEGELDAARRKRFTAFVAADSRKLSEVSRMLASFFTPEQAATRSRTPGEEVDDFVERHENHFPALEDAAMALREAVGMPSAGDIEAALLRYLNAHADGQAAPPATAAGPDAALDAARRFSHAEAVARIGAREAIEVVLRDSPLALSEGARDRVRRLLAAYVAGAMLMPYAAFLAAAEQGRYDLDRLCQLFNVSFEQACHRLVSLRRPGAQGLRFGFMRSDAAGYITKRFSLPGLALPLHGHGCPLWALFMALQAPNALVRQLVEFPSGDRYLLLARAVEKDRAAWGRPRLYKSVMLMCEAVHADRLVYGDGIDLGPRASTCVPVGQGCRVCVRSDCAARQEEAIVAPVNVGAPG